jgi:trigger factor
MQVQVEDLSSVSKKLTFTLPTDKVDVALTEAYANLRKEVSMKGFRKGKVPRRVLEQRFGKHIQGEVGGQLISDAFDSALKERDLVPVSQPVVDPGELQRGREYTFSVTVEIKPTVEVTGWEGLDVEWPSGEVPDEEIDREIEQIRQRNSTVEALDDKKYKAQTGDIAMVTAEYEVEGKDEPWTITDLMVVVNQPMGFGAADWLGDKIEGMTMARKKSFKNEVVPDGAIDEDWNGSTGKLSIKLTEIKTQKLPELDDDLAQDEGFDSVALLRADIQFKLNERLSAHAREAAGQFALKKLAETNEFEVPEGLVRNEANNILQEQVSRMMSQGMRAPKISLDNLQEEQQSALLADGDFSVRRALILDSVAVQAGDAVQVTDADIDERIEQLAQQMNQQPAAVKGLLQKNNRMDDLTQHLREEKALDLILERANIIEVELGGQSGDDGQEQEDSAAIEESPEAAEAGGEDEPEASEE